MNEKTPEEILEQSTQARETAEKQAIERGALPAEQPPRVIHGHPASGEAVPPPPITNEGGPANPVIVATETGLEQIDGRQDIVSDAALATQPLGANGLGEHGPLSDAFPFTDEYIAGKVYRADGAIVWADGSSTVDTAGNDTPNPAPLTGIADAAPTVLVAEAGAPDIQSIIAGVEPDDRVVTYREALPADELPKAADSEANVSTNSQGSYGDVAGQTFDDVNSYKPNPNPPPIDKDHPFGDG